MNKVRDKDLLFKVRIVFSPIFEEKDYYDANGYHSLVFLRRDARISHLFVNIIVWKKMKRGF